jgi:hypothetical protein
LNQTTNRFVLEVGAGELFDRLTILELKARHAQDPPQRHRANRELRRARDLNYRSGLLLGRIAPLITELRAVNQRLWDIENELRLRETNQDFGPAFVELSRAVYKNNDRRAAVKRRIDVLLSPTFLQDKIYAAFGTRRTRGRATPGTDGSTREPSPRPVVGRA